MLRSTLSAALLILPICLTRAAEPNPERIIYTALRPAGWDLYRLAGPDAEPQRLTTDPALDYNAVISPDGRWLVFCSERRGSPDLFVLDLRDGGPERLLVGTDAMEDAPAISPDGKSLAFVSTRDGNAEIYVTSFSPEAPGPAGDAKNISNNPRGDFQPAFSPDGQWLAFSSDRDAYKESEIYIAKSDGSELKRLTESSGYDGSPAWSSDGKTIYFYSESSGGSRIFKREVDSGTETPISPTEHRAVSPTILPDGRIAYTAEVNDKWGIYSVNEDGGDVRQESDSKHNYWAPVALPSGEIICHGVALENSASDFQGHVSGEFAIGTPVTAKLPDRPLSVHAVAGAFPSANVQTGEIVTSRRFDGIVISQVDGADLRSVFKPDTGSVWRPSWSKKGDRIACTVGPTFAQAGTNADIWSFRPDGSDAKNLTGDSPGNDGFPDFSPDGSRVVFRSGRDGNHEIYLMNSDGTDPRRLTEDPAVDTMPAFGPEGDRIAFTSERGGDYEIYILQLTDDGGAGELRRVTESPGRDTHPKFSPDGKWLVFASERGGMNDESPLIPVFNPQPYGEIFAVNLEDGTLVRLTYNKWEDGTPTWTPAVEK